MADYTEINNALQSTGIYTLQNDEVQVTISIGEVSERSTMDVVWSDGKPGQIKIVLSTIYDPEDLRHVVDNWEHMVWSAKQLRRSDLA